MSEHNHQAAFVEWFKAAYPQYSGCIIANANGAILGGKNKYGQLAKLKKEGFKPGVSDVFIAVPVGDKSGLWVEMKDEGKSLSSVSKAQMDHLDLMRKVGYEAIWASGFEVAKAATEVYMDGLGK